jgi:predicted ribosomally synthesized peptide with nif11-like leader
LNTLTKATLHQLLHQFNQGAKMSIQAAQDFRQQVNASADLQAAVAGHVKDGNIDYAGLSTLGRSHGYEFSANDAKSALSAASDELSEFEMELVSGGFIMPPQFNKPGRGHF